MLLEESEHEQWNNTSKCGEVGCALFVQSVYEN